MFITTIADPLSAFWMTTSGFSDSSLMPSVSCLLKLLYHRALGLALRSPNLKAL